MNTKAPKIDDATAAEIQQATAAANEIDKFLRQFSAVAKLSETLGDFSKLQNVVAERRLRLDQLGKDEAAAAERLATAQIAIVTAQEQAAAISTKATADAGAVVAEARASADKIITAAKFSAANIVAEANAAMEAMEVRRKRLADAVAAVS